MVHALKYRGQLVFGRVLGELLASRVAAVGLDAGIDCVLPVPLHPRRHAERGFNQSAEIARFTARALEIPLEARLAVRRSQTRPQVGLTPGQRYSNVQGAFAAAPVSLRGRHVAIVDDVITTGSTVAELARALCEAGATVDVWCVASASLR
jgi:ComF family protein